jgi:hypothetical protein
LKGTPSSGERKIGKILSVELMRDDESLSSKYHNFLLRCLIEVPFFATQREKKNVSININEHVFLSFEWIYLY